MFSILDSLFILTNLQMQNLEQVNMDIIVEDLSTLLERLSTLQTLYQLQQNLDDENERLVLKATLDNVVTRLVQSHVKTVWDRSSASILNLEKQKQDGMLATKLCSHCGKMKRYKTADTEVMTELNVIQRFKAAGHPGDVKVISKERDEMRSQGIKRKNQMQRGRTNPPLLARKVESETSKGVVHSRQRVHKEDRNAQDLHLPVQKPADNGVHHRKSKDKQMQGQRKTPGLKRMSGYQHGHFRKVEGGLSTQVFGPNLSRRQSAPDGWKKIVHILNLALVSEFWKAKLGFKNHTRGSASLMLQKLGCYTVDAD
ncbi:uncharacterized protein LOC113339005 isoform X1 [Papaver somniferum]|uniref:uncharacterized protein LOC113339005 isoform X1 n=2 Tax=Papaver somniferum TaxID=3469 RepID=UPI000E6FC1C3|nr:uncharacterized protein LOC113339005 isoform X1 [Papaver somniferum]